MSDTRETPAKQERRLPRKTYEPPKVIEEARFEGVALKCSFGAACLGISSTS